MTVSKMTKPGVMSTNQWTLFGPLWQTVFSQSGHSNNFIPPCLLELCCLSYQDTQPHFPLDDEPDLVAYFWQIDGGGVDAA